jgi:ATP-binding cassette subfamily C protein
VNAYRLLFKDLTKRLGWRFPVLIIWTALVGISESASIVLLLPLLDRIGLANAGARDFTTSLVKRSLALLGATGTGEILAAVVIVAAVQLILSLALNWWSVRLARNYQSQRQLEMFGAFMRAKWTFIADRKAGEMTNAIVTESERLGRAFTISLALLASVVIAVIYVGLSALVAWQVTLALFGVAALGGLAMTGLYKKSYAVGEKLAPLNAQLQSLLDEQFAAAKFVKACAGVDRATAQVEPLVVQLGDANAFASVMPAAVRSVLEYLALIGLAVVLALATTGSVSAANVVIVLALFARLFPRVTAVQAQMHYLNTNVHAIESINALQGAAEAQAERQDGPSEPLRIDLPAALIIRDLQVKFDERIVLDRINLALPMPGLLAVVGRSGAGKSTLAHALLGLVEPTVGSVLLGNHELAVTPLRAWRSAIGYVPQETVLFHATIRENITMINVAASDAEIELAVRRAHAQDFIKACPQGFDTVIGDQGVKLSGGQRQRLGIARALLANPVLLLMDEPMSALDGESEADLMRTIDELRRQIGIVMIAHRLATVREADCICVLDGGQVAEVGTWNELMTRRSRLHALVEAQALDTGQVAAVG